MSGFEASLGGTVLGQWLSSSGDLRFVLETVEQEFDEDYEVLMVYGLADDDDWELVSAYYMERSQEVSWFYLMETVEREAVVYGYGECTDGEEASFVVVEQYHHHTWIRFFEVDGEVPVETRYFCSTLPAVDLVVSDSDEEE